jgi:cbb3-type cytochrome c oxidase subunit III
MRRLACLIACAMLAVACRQDMQDQPRYEPLEASAFFEDGRSSRPLTPGTVARGQLDDADLAGDAQTTRLPIPMTAQVLARGEERYNIYCSPCHDRVGSGDGMVVRRGFRRPPSFHLERLREVPVGYYFSVISSGFGTMPSYAAQIPPRDRWAIVAHVRALQRSQHATVADVPPAEQKRLEEGGE